MFLLCGVSNQMCFKQLFASVSSDNQGITVSHEHINFTIVPAPIHQLAHSNFSPAKHAIGRSEALHEKKVAKALFTRFDFCPFLSQTH